MKSLVVGLGSMGKRRIRCLLAADQRDIVAVDLREDRRKEAEEKHGVRTSADFDKELAAVDAVFVCVPGYLHMKFCLQAARAGKHWFTEVPLCTSLEGIDELRFLTQKNALVGAVGCQLLFHPLGLSLREWSKKESPVLHISSSCGMYLPGWHSYEDYRSFYASDKSKGGGNLDVIAQDLAWINWIVNRPMTAVTARTGKVGKLELGPGTPDHQELIVEYKDGAMLSMHLDLNDRTYERWTRFTATESTARWSSATPHVDYFDARQNAWTKVEEPAGFVYEQCYKDEVKAFLNCIKDRKAWPISLESAEEIVRLLLAIDRSSTDGKTIRISEV